MLMFALLSLAAAPPEPSSATDPWPTTPAGRIIATPDWSDYRIYPKDALKKDQQGRVRPELWIGRDGRPKACRILSSSYYPELDAGTCKLMMQMRFEPVQDTEGRPVESHYSRFASWRLTEEVPFQSGRLRARIGLAGGHVQDCGIERSDGPYTQNWSGSACSILSDRSYYFANRANDSLTAIIEVRLDANDQLPLLQEAWPVGTVIASEKVSFVINASGDASECTAIESHNFGPRGLNNLSPCGRLLSVIWFAPPEQRGTERRGSFETRVVVLDTP